MKWIMTALLVVGGLLCCLNFYLSFLRYPVHRFMGKKKDEYRWISGIPVFGSLFVAISLLGIWQLPLFRAAAIGLILIDTGGLHWFAGTMLWYKVLKKGNRPNTESPAPADR